ncbi:MAG: sortase, partial [Anaerolineae bacterium]|nr:sortase [Anaerolineae bacterium]
TPDPLAHIPTATAARPGVEAGAVLNPLTLPLLGDPPPTFIPTPEKVPSFLLPETSATLLPTPDRRSTAIPTANALTDLIPDRLSIPRLNLDVPVEVVGLIPSPGPNGVYEWEVPSYRAAGWLNRSAPWGQTGNTVLDGHHNVAGEVFRNLWTLEPGDSITLTAEDRRRTYRVAKVLILPERDEPLEVRLQNAAYIQPTEDERLTLITCYPYEDNSHRTVVIAFPQEAGDE